MPKINPVSAHDYLVSQVNKFTPGKTAGETTEKIKTILSTFQSIPNPLSLQDRCQAINALDKLQMEEVKHYHLLQSQNCPNTLQRVKTNLIKDWLSLIEQDPQIENEVKQLLRSFSIHEKRQIMQRVYDRMNNRPFCMKLLSFSKGFTTILKEEIQKIPLLDTLQKKLNHYLQNRNLEKLSIPKIHKALEVIQKHENYLPSDWQTDPIYSGFLRRWNIEITEKIIFGDPIIEGSICRDIYFGKKIQSSDLLDELDLMNLFYSNTNLKTKINLIIGVQKIKSNLISLKIPKVDIKTVVKDTIENLKTSSNLELISPSDLEDSAIIPTYNALLNRMAQDYPIPKLGLVLKSFLCSLQDKKNILKILYNIFKKIETDNEYSSSVDFKFGVIQQTINNLVVESVNVDEIIKGLEKIEKETIL